jgi:hypothetical protein
MEAETFYILRVKGLSNNRNYLQIRDSKLSLLANIRYSPPYDNLTRFFKDNNKTQRVIEIMDTLPYGKLTKIEF